MQAVIAIPAFNTPLGIQKAGELLSRKVAGVALLKRVILTAIRAGATDILLVGQDVLGQLSHDRARHAAPRSPARSCRGASARRHAVAQMAKARLSAASSTSARLQE